ncbi:MAG: Sugar transferase involved in lipopolysaccharide synthesis [Herbinix sp.]|jgi:O-antigen biosynthesis protein WbqP|nr:Sugar transferase involved in lipopolysaccharide synthesis [Herbinix sp.]
MSGIYEAKLKQILDRIICGGLLLFLWPLLLIISGLIKLEDGGRVLFTQYRLGKDRRLFKIYKFRTMKENHDNPQLRAFLGDNRITRIGAVLRKTSLDELPQLINILKGDMAIIGPRPILPEEVDTPKGEFPYENRFSCLPGLCCSVDIKYRAAADRELQFTMDTSYAENIRLSEDIAIALRIVGTVIRGKNVYRDE